MTGIRCTNLLQHIPHEQGHGYPRTPTVVPFDQAPRAAAAKHLLPALRPTHCRVCDRRSPSCSLTLCADQSLSKRASSPRGCRRTPLFCLFACLDRELLIFSRIVPFTCLACCQMIRSFHQGNMTMPRYCLWSVILSISPNFETGLPRRSLLSVHCSHLKPKIGVLSTAQVP